MTRAYFSDGSTISVSGPNRNVLESSAKAVEHHMMMDGSYSELVDCLKMGADLPSVSGLSDQDYPGISELGVGFHSLTQLSVAKKVPLPSELVEQFGYMQLSCQMGLFPEIGRAWLTIDSNVFIWSFYDGSDLAYYDELAETVLCVGLAKPKPGVFQSFIHYILCLATPVEIVLLGVSFSRENENSSPYEEMHLLPEPLFRFPTDNIIMSCFASTENGRIFLGGRDGCIYEFAYQAVEGWFRRKCRKINHSSSPFSFLVPAFFQVFSKDDAISQISIDDSRNILYVMSENGTIQVFDLSTDGTEMNRVASVSQQSIVSNAALVARTIDRKHFASIVHIAAVEASESKHVNLVAVTSTGVRLYFTTNPSYSSYSSRPSSLCLLHVRMPPGFSANAIGDRPSNVHLALYRKGFLMLAASIVEEHDFLFTTSNDSFLLSNHLVETYTGVNLDGRAWALSEIVAEKDPMPRYGQSPKDGSTTEPPLLITQHSESPRQFVVLSTQGCSILTKPRPVDQLQKLFTDNKGSDCDAVKAFFKLHGEAQACAMCLILACNRSPQVQQISEWATRAFFMYGGNPQVNVISSGDGADSQVSMAEPMRPPVWASTPAQREPVPQSTFSHLSSVYSPVRPAMSTQQNVSMSSPLISRQAPALNISSNAEIVFSPKHDGLHLYFSRIIRPLWNMKLVCDKLILFESPPKSALCSTIPAEDISEFYQQLSNLKDFMQRYHPSFVNVGNVSIVTNRSRVLSAQTIPHEVSTSGTQVPANAQSEAEVQERASLQNLQLFISYTCEVLGLWKVLCDHQLESIISSLDQSKQELLKQMTFKDIIVDGGELCGALSTALINYYLEDNANTASVSQRLREVCPNIYKAEDATISRAQEIVISVKGIANKVEKEKKLMEALKLSKSICLYLDIAGMCSLFRAVDFYYGIVDLCLSTAQKLDPQGLAVHFYKNGKPPNDQQGFEVFCERERLYKIIIDTISDLSSSSLTQAASFLSSSSEHLLELPSALLSPDEAKKYSEFMFTMALKSDDELFHSALYDWLIENNQIDTLLSVKSHYLENYLKRRTTVHPDCTESLDLLWKFYEKNQNFSAAARVLAKLAEKSGSDLNLAQRIEYLSRAIICVKSSEMRLTASGEGEFLHELEEKMEVARIQLQVLDMLKRKTIPGVQDSIAKLNSVFMNITELYEDYAVPYDLPECKLAIVHCADHYDPSLIESLWQSIIDKEFISSCGNLPETRVKILQQKILSLSQAYKTSEKYFPVAFIIKYLEFKSCIPNFSLNWVYQTMLQIGLPLTEILTIYHKMYKSKDTCWLTVKKPLHLLQVLSLLIGEYVDKQSLVPRTEKRAFENLCLDFIAGYLVDLQAMSATDPLVSSLMKDFKAIQHNLERLIF